MDETEKLAEFLSRMSAADLGASGNVDKRVWAHFTRHNIHGSEMQIERQKLANAFVEKAHDAGLSASVIDFVSDRIWNAPSPT